MNVCIQADAVAVGRALIAALLFVSERAASFSEAKFDDTAFGSVLERWRTHWTFCNRNFARKRLGVRLRARAGVYGVRFLFVIRPQTLLPDDYCFPYPVSICNGNLRAYPIE